LQPDVPDQAEPSVCDPCKAIVCGTEQQFLCEDTLAACSTKYDACKLLTCDVPQVVPSNDETPIPTESECTVDSDCPTIICIRAPCPANICVGGMCVAQQVTGCGDGICEPDEKETCRTDCAGRTCGDGVCQSWEKQICRPCDPTQGVCSGIPCYPDDWLCPQDCT